MKMQKWFVAMCLVAGLSMPALGAESIGFNFCQGVDPTYMYGGHTGGLPAVSQSNWNNGDVYANPSGSISTVTNQDGTTLSGVTIAWTASGQADPLVDGTCGPGDSGRMMECYARGDAPSATERGVVTVTISNLTSSFDSGYMVYLYMDSHYWAGGYDHTQSIALDYGNNGSIDQSGSFPSTTGSVFNGDFTGFYKSFGVSSSGVSDLKITLTAGEDNMRAYLNGMQIVVPEPATMVLLLIGLPLALRRRRR